MTTKEQLRKKYFDSLEWLKDGLMVISGLVTEPAPSSSASLDKYKAHAKQFANNLLNRQLSKMTITSQDLESQWQAFYYCQLEQLTTQLPSTKLPEVEITDDPPLVNQAHDALFDYINMFYRFINADYIALYFGGFKFINPTMFDFSSATTFVQYNKKYNQLYNALESLKVKLFLEGSPHYQSLLSFLKTLGLQRKQVISLSKSDASASKLSATSTTSSGSLKVPKKKFPFWRKKPSKALVDVIKRKELLRRSYFEGATWFDNFFAILKQYTHSDVEYKNVIVDVAAIHLGTTTIGLYKEAITKAKKKIKNAHDRLDAELEKYWSSLAKMLKTNGRLTARDLKAYKESLRMQIDNIVFYHKDIARFETFIKKPLDTRLMYTEHHYHDGEAKTTILGCFSRKTIKAFTEYVEAKGLDAKISHRNTKALIDVYSKVNLYIGILYMLVDPRFKQKIYHSQRLVTDFNIPESKLAITDDMAIIDVQLEGLQGAMLELVKSIEVYLKYLRSSILDGDYPYTSAMIKCLEDSADAVKKQCQFVVDYLHGKPCEEPEGVSDMTPVQSRRKSATLRRHGKQTSLMFHNARRSFDSPSIDDRFKCLDIGTLSFSPTSDQE